MPTLSIVTPWSGETGHLLADYYRAVEGGLAEVISVDNGCPPATADALREMTEHLCGVYIRNETNAGFAAANNQGYAKATGDSVIFLNSDVAPAGLWLYQVLADMKDGALYGPSLAAQLVAGRHVPYVEGWCIAATRATWGRITESMGGPPLILMKHQDELPTDVLATLRQELHDFYADNTRRTFIAPISTEIEFISAQPQGPWDAHSYPDPYWEDNDLCLRALRAGIALVQTAWPIQHKGGQTAGPIIRHAESFARNEATFTARVLEVLRQPEMTPAWERYMQAYHTQSDIQHHIGLLYSLARGTQERPKYVLELGTRGGVSTAALLAGVEATGGFLWSIDTDPNCAEVAKGHPQWRFIQADSRGDDGDVGALLADMFPSMPTGFDPVGPPDDGRCIDLILCDTLHTYEHVGTELAAWSSYMAPGGHILLHDPETFPGVRRAVTEFCAARGWPVTFVLPCHGMAVIEVPCT